MRFIAVILVITSFLAACDGGPSEAYIERTRACEPLPLIEGYRTVKLKFLQSEGEVSLRLPEHVMISRAAAIYDECEYLRYASANYILFRNELIPGWHAREEIPSSEFIRVRLGSPQVFPTADAPPREAWQFSPSLPHNRFPLDYFPRFLLDDPDNPSELSISLSRLNHIWGIRGTRYKSFDNLPFVAVCNILPVDPNLPDSRVQGPFSDNGDSKCRGGAGIEKNGIFLSVAIDVWADGAEDINQIYDAVVEQLDVFIPE